MLSHTTLIPANANPEQGNLILAIKIFISDVFNTSRHKIAMNDHDRLNSSEILYDSTIQVYYDNFSQIYSCK